MTKTRKFSRAAMLLLMMLLTTTTAWALNVTCLYYDNVSGSYLEGTGGGTYEIVDGTKLYVTPNPGYYLVSVKRDGEANPLVEENGYYTVSATDNITITFKPYTNNVLVKFNMKGHGDAIADRNQTLGQTVERPTPDPTADGYVFLGWYTNSSCTTRYDFATVLDNTLAYDTYNDCYTLTLYAGWVPNAVRVSFDMKGHGTAIAARDQTLGEMVERPTPDPTADDYAFFGWFTDSECTMPYDFTTVLDNSLTYDTSNERFTLTLHAMWLAEASLTFSGTCGKVDTKAKPPLDGTEVTWAVTKGADSDNYDVLTISGSGAMADYKNMSGTRAPWYNFRSLIKTIVIDEGVTAIGNYAFYEFVNVTSDITIPASVTSIGNYALKWLSKNTTAGIHITAAEGSALASIGKDVFYSANASIDLSPCTSLTAFNEIYVFNRVTKDVILPSSLESICEWAFNRYIEGAFLGDHVYVVVPDGKALSVTITLDEGTESVILEPTDGKADILYCLYADPTVERTLSRALTLAAVAKDFTTDGHAGTEADPYIIYNKEQLNLLAQRVNNGESYSGKFFQLGKDITYTHTTDWDDADSEENNYTAIGQRISNDDKDNNPFSGTFDGDGHTVSGIRIYKSGGSDWSDHFQGLFGYVVNGTVKNVTLADARITGEMNVGGIVGWLNCFEGSHTIENCHVLGTVAIYAVEDYSWNHGGIAGCSCGSVLHCTSAATLTIMEGITGCKTYGGIVGSAMGTLRHNMAIGCTIPDVPYRGAIAGENYNKDCTFEYNYYGGCTVGTTPTASGIGCDSKDIEGEIDFWEDLQHPDGAVPATEFTNEPVGSGYVFYNEKYYAPTCRTVVMNANGIRTFATVADLDFSGIEDFTAYFIEDFNGTTGTLTLKKIKKVPAGTGLLLKGPASTTFVIPFAESTDDIWNNYLVGVTCDETVVPVATDDNTNFILANGSSGINWYTLENDGAIGAYKAYLSLPTDELDFTSGAPSFTWVYGDGSTTTIDNGELRIENSTDAWHTLDGRRLSGKPTQRGIYINNGKKIVIK